MFQINYNLVLIKTNTILYSSIQHYSFTITERSEDLGQRIAIPNIISNAITINEATVIMKSKLVNSLAESNKNINIGNCTKGDNIRKVHKSPGWKIEKITS